MFRTVAKSISDLENGGKKNLPLRRTFNAFATAARQGQLFGGARTQITNEPVKYFDMLDNVCAVLKENGSVDVKVKETTQWLLLSDVRRQIVDLAVGTIGVVTLQRTSVRLGIYNRGDGSIDWETVHNDNEANFVKVATTKTPLNEDGDQEYRQTVAVVDKRNNKIQFSSDGLFNKKKVDAISIPHQIGEGDVFLGVTQGPKGGFVFIAYKRAGHDMHTLGFCRIDTEDRTLHTYGRPFVATAFACQGNRVFLGTSSGHITAATVGPAGFQFNSTKLGNHMDGSNAAPGSNAVSDLSVGKHGLVSVGKMTIRVWQENKTNSFTCTRVLFGGDAIRYARMQEDGAILAAGHHGVSVWACKGACPVSFAPVEEMEQMRDDDGTVKSFAITSEGDADGDLVCTVADGLCEAIERDADHAYPNLTKFDVKDPRQLRALSPLCENPVDIVAKAVAMETQTPAKDRLVALFRKRPYLLFAVAETAWMCINDKPSAQSEHRDFRYAVAALTTLRRYMDAWPLLKEMEFMDKPEHSVKLTSALNADACIHGTGGKLWKCFWTYYHACWLVDANFTQKMSVLPFLMDQPNNSRMQEGWYSAHIDMIDKTHEQINCRESAQRFVMYRLDPYYHERGGGRFGPIFSRRGPQRLGNHAVKTILSFDNGVIRVDPPRRRLRGGAMANKSCWYKDRSKRGMPVPKSEMYWANREECEGFSPGKCRWDDAFAEHVGKEMQPYRCVKRNWVAPGPTARNQSCHSPGGQRRRSRLSCDRMDACVWRKRNCVNACDGVKKQQQCAKREDCAWSGGGCRRRTGPPPPGNKQKHPPKKKPAAPHRAPNDFYKQFYEGQKRSFAVFRRYEHMFSLPTDTEPPTGKQLVDRGGYKFPPVILAIRAKHDKVPKVFGDGSGVAKAQEAMYGMHPHAEVRYLVVDRVEGESDDPTSLSLFHVLDDVRREGRKILHLFLLAHGAPRAITLGDPNVNHRELNFDNIEAFANKLQEVLAPKASIMLNSCKTGSENVSVCIAGRLSALLLGVPVSAPTDNAGNWQIDLTSMPIERDNTNMLYKPRITDTRGMYTYRAAEGVGYRVRTLVNGIEHVIENPDSPWHTPLQNNPRPGTPVYNPDSRPPSPRYRPDSPPYRPDSPNYEPLVVADEEDDDDI